EKPLTESADLPPGQEKIRILVVDDNRETTENVSRLIYFENDMEVIGQAYTGREGVEVAAREKPHIVLMDINMPDMDGITATRKMVTEAPFSQVIIMSVQSDAQYMKQAMAAGARDFQPKPFTADELVSCIRRVYKKNLATYRQLEAAQAAQQPAAPTAAAAPAMVPTFHAPVVVVYSPKGGVGTSTVAANLAVAWQKMHQNIAVLDANLEFGDLAVHLNVHTTRTLGDLTNRPDVDADLIAQVMTPHASGLQILLAPPRPEIAELVKPDLLHTTIAHLRTQCRTLVVDTGSYLSDQTLALFDVADFMLIVATPNLPGVKDIRLLLELIKELNYSLERVGIVMNRADMPGHIPLEKIKNALKFPRIYALPNDPNVQLAINRGVTMVEAGVKSPLLNAIGDLAKGVWEEVTNLGVKEETAG
ncbi:MAG: response regulator, partial [Caldilineae bacterium]